jgi:hypothetical protein
MDAPERQKPAPGDLCLDHVAHFVPDLDAAARLAQALGFAITPVSHHTVSGQPAGTANRCIMFEQGYVEILSPTLDTPNARRVRTRMARYAGVHLACFGTPDAEAEQRRLAAHGFDPEPLVRLQRETGSGVVRFKVIYVPPERMPEGRVQYVEHVSPEVIWTAASLAHSNGVIGLTAVFVVADNPTEVAARWARFSALLPCPDGEFVRLDSARGQVLIGTRAGLARLLGEAPPAPAIAGYGLAFRDPAAFLARCASHGLRRHGNAVLLPPELGGAWLIDSAAQGTRAERG